MGHRGRGRDAQDSELPHEPLPHTLSTNSNSGTQSAPQQNGNQGRLAVKEGGRERETTNKQGLREGPDTGWEGEA